MIQFYQIKIQSLLEILHTKCNIIHGDIKPDNFLINFKNSKEWEHWDKNSSKGWENKGLKLIDFGLSKDLRLYPDNVSFKGNVHASNFKCIEMQENKEWTYQIDIFGMLGTIHTMLFGCYMETKKSELSDTTSINVLKKPFKRFWQVNLWNNLFNQCLNIKDCQSIPNLTTLRNSFEDYLEQNPRKSNSLKSLLMKQNLLIYNNNK